MTRKKKNGFTLIEMMTVLMMISILSLISVGALYANSKYQRISKSVEEIVILLREAQNRSVAIRKEGGETKAWEFYLRNGSYAIVPLNSIGGKLAEGTPTDQDKGDLPLGTQVSVNYYGGQATASSQTFSSVFTTPFARAYLAPSYDFTRTQAVSCSWLDGSESTTAKPAKDWYFDPGCTSPVAYNPSNAGRAEIVLSYLGNVITVTVNSNGDVFYQ